MKQKETTNVNDVNLNEVTNLRLLMTGLFNAEKVKQLTSEQLREFIETDTATRLTRWIGTHFSKEDPVTTRIEVDAEYTIMDYHYNKQGKYICQLFAQIEENVVLSIKANDIQRKNEA